MSHPVGSNRQGSVLRFEIGGNSLPSEAPLSDAAIGRFRPIDSGSISKPDLSLSSPVPGRTEGRPEPRSFP